jgi:hypothetical protein
LNTANIVSACRNSTHEENIAEDDYKGKDNETDLGKFLAREQILCDFFSPYVYV